MDKKNFDDEWNPADYEIYTREEEPQSEQEAPVEVIAPPETEVPKIQTNKKKKRKSKSNALIVILSLLLVAVIVGAVALIKFLPEGKEKIKKIISDDTNISQIDNGNVVRVTFPEGYTVYQYGKLLEEKGVCSKEDFYKAANTPVEGVEIPTNEERVFLLEGYLFPDTYDFYKNESAESVIQRFIDNYNSKVTDEMKSRAESLGYTMDEMLTLASIIQKECDCDINECRNVSSVFHNRLAQSKESYLGSDVTYFYLKNMADYLGGSDSEKFDYFLMKYYTYRNYRKGLPAGAICNPGIKAIEAALSPNDTDYRYFLTDESGEKFYYAETFEQHQKNGKLAGLEGF